MNDKKKSQKREEDRELTEELKQSFPASDPPTVTRQPADQRHVESEQEEEKKGAKTPKRRE